MVNEAQELHSSERNTLITLKKVIRLLNKEDKRKLVFVVILQTVLGFLDLLGVALVGVLSALTVSGVQSTPPQGRVLAIIEFLNLQNQSFQFQAGALGVSAAFVLILRTVFSIFITRRILFFLSRRSAVISGRLVRKLLNQSILVIQQRTFQETVYSLTTGINALVVGIIGALAVLFSDLSLLVILSIGLFVVDPVVAILGLSLFSGVAVLLYIVLHKRAHALGSQEAALSVSSYESIIEVLGTYREAVVRNRRDFYARKFEKIRLNSANVLAELSFLPNISKYVIESAIIITAVGVSAIQFIRQDAGNAIGTLTIFLAAGSRIAPAIMRVQQGALQVKSNLGAANPTLGLIQELELSKNLILDSAATDTISEFFKGDAKLEKVSLTYPGVEEKSLTDISISIPAGKFFAIVGPSGAGKTSLVDVLLGIIPATSGEVLISGLHPQEVARNWPGKIGYVPQEVIIVNGTLRENIALGYDPSEFPDSAFERAIILSSLESLVNSNPDRIDMQVGDRGVRLSGGQRQRIGLARALLTNPQFLVLDEATSALDGDTEANISQAIQSLRQEMTIVMIAHRLSTVRLADQLIYMESGKVVLVGTFNELKDQIPNFDRQAKLMGL